MHNDTRMDILKKAKDFLSQHGEISGALRFDNGEGKIITIIPVSGLTEEQKENSFFLGKIEKNGVEYACLATKRE